MHTTMSEPHPAVTLGKNMSKRTEKGVTVVHMYNIHYDTKLSSCFKLFF